MEDIIKKAIEGGFEDYIVVAPVKEKFQEYCLDPFFWQAFGKNCGWKQEITGYTYWADGEAEKDYSLEEIEKEDIDITDYAGWEQWVPIFEGTTWKITAMKFHEINLTEGWDKAVEYLSALTIKEE